MRRHHEELVAASSMWPTLSLLIPFSVAVWARIKATRKTEPDTDDPGKPRR